MIHAGTTAYSFRCNEALARWQLQGTKTTVFPRGACHVALFQPSHMLRVKHIGTIHSFTFASRQPPQSARNSCVAVKSRGAFRALHRSNRSAHAAVVAHTSAEGHGPHCVQCMPDGPNLENDLCSTMDGIPQRLPLRGRRPLRHSYSYRQKHKYVGSTHSLHGTVSLSSDTVSPTLVSAHFPQNTSWYIGTRYICAHTMVVIRRHQYWSIVVRCFGAFQQGYYVPNSRGLCCRRRNDQGC